MIPRLVLAAAVILGIAGPAYAADAPNCGLARFSALPITTLDDGRFAIPVTVQDKAMSFMVDTGGVSATITESQARALNLHMHATFRWLSGVAGSHLTVFVRADSFSIGRLKGEDLPIYIDPRLGGAGVDGTLAPDMLGHFDVDIDFAHSMLNLFSQDHCPGKVVYWARDYVTIPMTFAPNGHIRVPVTVDGKPVMAMLDTGARTSVLSLSMAKSLGIAEQDPKLHLKRSFGPGQKYREYSYPFQTLELQGLTVKNPNITIYSDSYTEEVGNDMIIGAGILRQLHLYIAYKEQKLYVTPAEAN